MYLCVQKKWGKRAQNARVASRSLNGLNSTEAHMRSYAYTSVVTCVYPTRKETSSIHDSVAYIWCLYKTIKIIISRTNAGVPNVGVDKRSNVKILF